MKQDRKSDLEFLSKDDIYLFREGRHYRLYDKLGSRPIIMNKRSGTRFAVWAPNASSVSVIGDFNQWGKNTSSLSKRTDGSGIWEGFIADVGEGDLYKYHIRDASGRHLPDKIDPFARLLEVPPRSASIVAEPRHHWGDTSWMGGRKAHHADGAPLSIYEIHLGSWRRSEGENKDFLNYRDLIDPLTAYVLDMGFTHVEFLPIMEHPFYGSWGYQTLGYFAPTGRYGRPEDLMALIDHLHQAGIGVILDWVPSHFPADGHGLARFDGTHLYEHKDPRQGFHPDWKSLIFNYGRNEVCDFLVSSALFWLDRFHADGLRVDAVASMLYLDYSRKDGEWIPNRYGGRENLEATAFLRTLNQAIRENFPDTLIIAEESTAWPGVTNQIESGGLGFSRKWNMGWMHDTLVYMRHDPVHRRFHQDKLSFSLWYAFSERFILPLSHDEVVHGKGSLLEKMPGDTWRKFANLRLLMGWMFSHPGQKLLFMGDEFAQEREWDHERELDWALLASPPHDGIRNWVRDLNALYRREPALHASDFDAGGFEWIDFRDSDASIVSFLRISSGTASQIMVAANFTPVPRYPYRIGAPIGGEWVEVLNSDAREYGGSGQGNLGRITANAIPSHGHPYSLDLRLPPLAVIFLQADSARKGENISP